MPLPELPEWAEHTPSFDYQLHAFDGDNTSDQLIHLTREEFVQLKIYLAEIRGHVQPEDVPAVMRDCFMN